MVVSVGWTVSDTSYKNFNLVGQKCRTNGRRFAVEADAFSAPAGMRELERIMREEILTRPYFDKKIWKKYQDVFTQDKVKMRLLAALGEWIGEEMEDSGNNNSSSSSAIRDAIARAVGLTMTEEEELREIKGKDYKDEIDEEEE